MLESSFDPGKIYEQHKTDRLLYAISRNAGLTKLSGQYRISCPKDLDAYKETLMTIEDLAKAWKTSAASILKRAVLPAAGRPLEIGAVYTRKRGSVVLAIDDYHALARGGRLVEIKNTSQLEQVDMTMLELCQELRLDVEELERAARMRIKPEKHMNKLRNRYDRVNWIGSVDYEPAVFRMPGMRGIL